MIENPKVFVICATHGRHRCIERLLKMFMNQDYENKHLLIYNNSDVPQTLSLRVPSNVTLINNHIDPSTGVEFKTLGAIYNAALTHVPQDVDIITHMDDDDIFMPYHITEGVKGYKWAKYMNETIGREYQAYKPKTSFFRTSMGISESSNTFEPSIFVEADVIRTYKYSDTTADQHLSWVNYLVYNMRIFVPGADYKPSLVYNWGGDKDISIYKTSGNPGHPENFENVRNASADHGDKVLTPASDKEVDPLYQEVKDYLAKLKTPA